MIFVMNSRINTKPVCLFCSKLKGHAENIARLIPKYKGKKLIYYQTPHFLTTAELCPIVKDPYFLIVPKKHFKAFSQINKLYAREMDTIIRYLRGLFKHKKSYVIFEHGEVSGENKAQSVYHAHTHVIVTNKNYFLHILKKMKENKMNPEILKFSTHSTLEEIQKKVKSKNYLLFRQETVGALVKETKKMRIPSQTFRRWMYDFENPNKKFIDWKELDNEERQIIQKRLLSLPRQFILG